MSESESAKETARAALYEEITEQVKLVAEIRTIGRNAHPEGLLQLAEAFAWITNPSQSH